MSDLDAQWKRALPALREGLEAAFGALIRDCEAPLEALDRVPPTAGWTRHEVLEHVALTDHYLLILIDKIADRTRRRLERGDPWPVHGPSFAPLQRLASSERDWEAPLHMVPSDPAPPMEITRRLDLDRKRCLALLDEFPSGEGTLHRIRMSVVDGDDRLDLYQYLEIVRLHATRHVAQIERLKS
ncbi:MAG: DinB family protein [Planctomycetota bacterium]